MTQKELRSAYLSKGVCSQSVSIILGGLHETLVKHLLHVQHGTTVMCKPTELRPRLKLPELVLLQEPMCDAIIQNAFVYNVSLRVHLTRMCI